MTMIAKSKKRTGRRSLATRFLLGIAATINLPMATFAHAEPLPPGARYVALGSSFASGPGVQPMRSNGVTRCGQSAANYASLLAGRLNLALDDRSCGGATTAHIIGPWHELPPQIDAVTPDTKLVTITIGGNDLNYAGNVFSASCDKEEAFNAGGQTITCPTMKIPADADYIRLGANMREIARQVFLRAPQARLIFIQYVTLIPQRACPAARISSANARLLKAVARRLSAITTNAAKQSGALVLPIDRLSRHHTPCDAQPWSVGFPKNFDVTQGMPWHPNRTGMVAITDALIKLLTAH